MKNLGRRLLLASALLSLILGVLAGLARLGYGVGPAAGLAGWHGAVMTGGFAGLLISLERAVALERPWGYGAPLLVLGGTLGLLLGLESAPWAYAAAGPWALAVQLKLGLRRLDAASWVMALGTLAWALGMAVWAAQGDFVMAVLLWAAFPTLVIAGERLELAFSVLPGGGAWWAFLTAVAATLLGPLLLPWWPVAGPRMAALGWLSLSLWMLRFDTLGRAFKLGGLGRYMSVALWIGYSWLAVAALLLWAWAGGDGALWDAALHSLFLGFMFAMIFAHAPVIFPAVAGIQLQWHRGHYVHLYAMSLALLARCAAGALGWVELKRGASMATALVLLIFLFNQLLSAVQARQASR